MQTPPRSNALAQNSSRRLAITEEARECLIRWIRQKMEYAGISLEALERSLIEDARAVRAILYRDALGNTWDGIGQLPQWLRRAVAAGQSIQHFRDDDGDAL
jgi:DNA-binding protein H-NS